MSMAPMIPTQIGHIWFHNFSFFFFVPSVPGWPKRRQGRPMEAESKPQERSRATPEKPKSRQEYGTNGTNPDWCHVGPRLRLFLADTERPKVPQRQKQPKEAKTEALAKSRQERHERR